MKPTTCKFCLQVNKHYSFQCRDNPKNQKTSLEDVNKNAKDIKAIIDYKPVEKKKAYKIPNVSDKMKERLKEYRIIRDDYMASHPNCQAMIDIVCTHKSSDLHHRAGRQGKLLTDKTYFLSCCRACHSYIETHPEESKQWGFSVTRLDK